MLLAIVLSVALLGIAFILATKSQDGSTDYKSDNGSSDDEDPTY